MSPHEKLEIVVGGAAIVVIVLITVLAKISRRRKRRGPNGSTASKGASTSKTSPKKSPPKKSPKKLAADAEPGKPPAPSFTTPQVVAAKNMPISIPNDSAASQFWSSTGSEAVVQAPANGSPDDDSSPSSDAPLASLLADEIHDKGGPSDGKPSITPDVAHPTSSMVATPSAVAPAAEPSSLPIATLNEPTTPVSSLSLDETPGNAASAPVVPASPAAAPLGVTAVHDEPAVTSASSPQIVEPTLAPRVVEPAVDPPTVQVIDASANDASLAPEDHPSKPLVSSSTSGEVLDDEAPVIVVTASVTPSLAALIDEFADARDDTFEESSRGPSSGDSSSVSVDTLVVEPSPRPETAVEAASSEARIIPLDDDADGDDEVIRIHLKISEDEISQIKIIGSGEGTEEWVNRAGGPQAKSKAKKSKKGKGGKKR